MPTVGIEIELALVDRESLNLASRIEHPLNRPEVQAVQGTDIHVKPDLRQCCVEITSGKQERIGELEVREDSCR
jgi:gamma-glutamyl:cysteine ligase YbdK (ATP-grasp superfamily)